MLREYHLLLALPGFAPYLDFLRFYIGRGVDRVAFGGMVGENGFAQLARNTSDIRAWLDEAFLVLANHPQVSIHAFGLTNLEVLDPYPWTTADSTSALMRTMFGNICVSKGKYWRPVEPETLPPDVARQAFAKFEVVPGKTRAYRYSTNVYTLTKHLENCGINHVYHALNPNGRDEQAAVQGCSWYVNGAR